MWRAAVALLSLLAVCWCAPAGAEEREWAYSKGGKFKAQLVRELDGDAIFLQGGKFLTVPLDELAEADRKLVLAFAEGKGEPDGPSSDRPQRIFKAPASAAPEAKVAPLVKPKTPVEDRAWTDTNGNRALGKFVRVLERNVVILRGKRLAALAYDELSPEDQNYVNQVLTERGEQPLDAVVAEAASEPPLAANEATDSPTVAEPAESAEAAVSDAKASGSRLFGEMREREADRRRQQEEFAAQNPAPPMSSMADTPAEDAAVLPEPALAFTEPHLAPPDGPGQPEAPLGKRHASGGLRIGGKTVAELRPILIMAGVLLGLFALLGAIVFIATTVASSGTRRHPKRLY